MTFEEWLSKVAPNPHLAHLDSPVELARKAWSAAQRELLLELTKAKMDGADAHALAEIQRAKNLKSLL